MIVALESSSADERLAAARRFLTSRSSGEEILLVGATREAIDDLAHDVSVERGAVFGLHRFSLRHLAGRLASSVLADRDLARMTRLGVEAVASRAAFEVRERGDLPYFDPVAGCPGFARAVAATVAEVRLAGFASDSLQSLAPAGGELAALLEEFDHQLDRAHAVDEAALLSLALEAVATGDAPLLSWPVLLLDVPVRSAADSRLLRALTSRPPDGLVTIPSGDQAARETFQGSPNIEHRRSRSRTPDTSLGRLQHHLFAPEPPPPGATDATVAFFSAPGETRESVEIARRILDHARHGTAFDRIAVLLRVPSLYTRLIETALRRAEIPAYFAPGTSRPDPSGRALLALLACASERLSAVRFAEYLSLGQVPNLEDGGAPPTAPPPWVQPRLDELPIPEPPGGGSAPVQESLPFDAAGTEEAEVGAPDEPREDAPVVAGMLRVPWRWEELLVEAAVIGGHDRWSRRLDGLSAELRLKSAELRSDEPDSPRVLAIERELTNLHHLRAFALPLVETLDGLPEFASWGEWIEHLTSLAGMALRQPERVLAVLAELRPMSTVGPVRLEEVRDVLLDRLATLEVEPPAVRFGRVFVATPDQVRGRSFDVVFVPGLAERVFPQKAREDPLLLDHQREQIPGELLRTQRHRAPEERLLLRLAVGAARSRVHLSYPRMGTALGEPRPRVPSFYGLDVQRATTGRIPDVDQLERDAALESAARLAWPAPPDPREAIDEIEHDLAVLGRLLRPATTSSVRGRARYLLRLNEHLARSLRARWGRWEVSGWSQFDGLTRATAETAAALAPHRLTARPYSVSSLQHFAACPYRFLLAAIYRLEPREEAVPLQYLDPLTRGSIFHEVQAEFLRHLERHEQLPITPADLPRAIEALDTTLDRVASMRREELAPAIPRVWNDEIEVMRADLRAWVHAMAADPSWEPIRFEFGFGMGADRSRDPRSVPEPAVLEGGFQLRGIVDLIERRRDGKALRVTDHKTGVDRTKAGLIVGGGETLQPVLYSLAVEHATGESVDRARLFFCTSRGGFNERGVAMDRHARDHGLAVLLEIDRSIEAGFLPPAPRERACQYCDFRDVCGPHEVTRVARKDQGPLGGLLDLRRIP